MNNLLHIVRSSSLIALLILTGCAPQYVAHHQAPRLSPEDQAIQLANEKADKECRRPHEGFHDNAPRPVTYKRITCILDISEQIWLPMAVYPDLVANKLANDRKIMKRYLNQEIDARECEKALDDNDETYKQLANIRDVSHNQAAADQALYMQQLQNAALLQNGLSSIQSNIAGQQAIEQSNRDRGLLAIMAAPH